MTDELTEKRFCRDMIPAIMSYKPGSSIIYDTACAWMEQYLQSEIRKGLGEPFETIANFLEIPIDTKLSDKEKVFARIAAKKFEEDVIKKIEGALKEKSI